MTREERIKSLARLYNYYMTEYHEAVRKLYKTVKEDEETVDVVCALTNVNAINRIKIDPILKLLQYEDVICMRRENGKTVIDTRDYLLITIDEVIEDPFRVDFPTGFTYDDD